MKATVRALVETACTAERQGHWGQERAALAQAIGILTDSSVAPAPKTARVRDRESCGARLQLHRLRPGAVLQRVVRGVVKASCTYIGEEGFKYRDTVYTSLSAAARAAASDLGWSARTRVDGWLFWGLERQYTCVADTAPADPDELDESLDEDGFDLTAKDADGADETDEDDEVEVRL